MTVLEYSLIIAPASTAKVMLEFEKAFLHIDEHPRESPFPFHPGFHTLCLACFTIYDSSGNGKQFFFDVSCSIARRA